MFVLLCWVAYLMFLFVLFSPTQNLAEIQTYVNILQQINQTLPLVPNVSVGISEVRTLMLSLCICVCVRAGVLPSLRGRRGGLRVCQPWQCVWGWWGYWLLSPIGLPVPACLCFFIYVCLCTYVKRADGQSNSPQDVWTGQQFENVSTHNEATSGKNGCAY